MRPQPRIFKFFIFFLEYVKDLRIIVIKKKSLTIQTRTLTSALAGLPVAAIGWTFLAYKFKFRYYINGT
jgi:hypothetical protein